MLIHGQKNASLAESGVTDSLTTGLVAVCVLVNEPAKLGREPGGIGYCEVNAHAPVTAGRTESNLEGSDERRCEHPRHGSHFQNYAIPLAHAGDDRARHGLFFLHFLKTQIALL
jgi:hypothetical protein